MNPLPSFCRAARSAAASALSACCAVALCAGTARAQARDAAGLGPGAADWPYTLQRGDTLIGLRDRLMQPGADWRVVQRLNRVANPRRLQPGSVLRIPFDMLQQQPLAAEVLLMHGAVWLERPGAQRQPLAADAQLQAGDALVTGAQSSVSLRFADGTRTQLGPQGRLVLGRHARLGTSGSIDTSLRLDAGGAEVKVPPSTPAPRFELRTPAVNLGVRGTEFRGRVDAQRSLAEVTEGRVAAGSQRVDAGFGTVATALGVAVPRRLLQAPDVSALPERVQRVPLQMRLGTAAGAVRFRAQLLDTADPPRLLLEGLFDAPLAAWPDDLPDGRYVLLVRAADADGLEGLTARHAFTLKARPEAPFLLKPRPGEAVTEAQVSLAWARNPQAARYKLQVAAQLDFSVLLVDRDDLTDTEASASLPLGALVWRVASVPADGDTGPWSDPQAFERVPPPPLPAAPAGQPPQSSDDGIVVSWSASVLPGASYQVQVARDAAFTDLVVDERTPRTQHLLAHPEPGTYHVRTRTIAADGRAGACGSAQVLEVPRSMWWLWLLPLLLLF